MKKILIFYSKTGSGHLRAAEAIKEEIEAQNKNTEVILNDGMENAALGVKTDSSSGYALVMDKLESLFNFIYLTTNNKAGIIPYRRLIKSVWGKTIRETIEKEQPDLIITTHHHISPATISKHNSKIPFITVITDLGYPHVMWFDKNVSRIITPTKLMADYAKKIIPDKAGQIVPIDYPIKNTFIPAKNEELSNTLLVAGGGSGSGNILEQVKILLKTLTDKKIVVVCGNNKKLFEDLNKIGSENLEVHGFVHHLNELYSKSDIIITKAGPGTIVEAAILKKPLIITSWVGLQEKDNIDFVVDNKLGIYTPDFEDLPKAVEKIYKNYDEYTRGQDFFNNGTKKIVDYILKEFA